MEYNLNFSRNTPNWFSTDNINILSGFFPNNENNGIYSATSGIFSIFVEIPYKNLNGENFSKEIKIHYTLNPWLSYNNNISSQLIGLTFFENRSFEPIKFELGKTFDDHDVKLITPESNNEYLDLHYANNELTGFAKCNTNNIIQYSELSFYHPTIPELVKKFRFTYNILPELIVNPFISISAEYNVEMTPANILEKIIPNNILNEKYDISVSMLDNSVLPSGLTFHNNYITGIPKSQYPLSTAFLAYYTDFPEVTHEIICNNNIIIGTSFAENLPYINGIGVVSYRIETKQQETPEFYTPEVPYIVESISANYSGYGWLYNTENILADINASYSQSISPISSFNRLSELYYYSTEIPITCEYSGVSGVLSGTLEYNPTAGDKICHGYMSGYLCRFNDLNTRILVDAYCTGEVEKPSGVLNNYFLKTLSRNLYRVK